MSKLEKKNHYERVFSIDEEGNITSWGLKAKNEEVVIEKKRRELTEQQKKVITHNKDLNELSKKLGGFITMYYVKNELLFNKVNISPASISRLIYIATYLDYNDRQNGLLVHRNKYNQLIPMDKKARYVDYAKGLQRILKQKEQNYQPKSVLGRLKQVKSETTKGGAQ